MIPHRLKRDSTKLNSADMLALLSFLEAQQRNRYDNGNGNDDINALEYPKSLYGPYGNFDAVDNDDDIVDGGEWWNEYIEPSVQYYGGGNGRGNGRFDENPRKRLTSTGTFNVLLLFLLFSFAFALVLSLCALVITLHLQYGEQDLLIFIKLPSFNSFRTVFPVKRFMVAKKKRANQHHVSDDNVAAAIADDSKDLKKKSLFGSSFGVDFNPRWTSA